jgi:DNA-binding Xre family transcriptional regulator
MQRRIRKRILRRMTDEERRRHADVRAAIEKEKPELIALGRRLLAQSDRLRETVRILKAEREAQGLTLQELGERTGIGKANLSRLENSRNPNPTVGTLARYAEALGKDLVITLDSSKRRSEPRRGQSVTRRNRGGAR